VVIFILLQQATNEKDFSNFRYFSHVAFLHERNVLLALQYNRNNTTVIAAYAAKLIGYVRQVYSGHPQL
jgi:hypothetical protein